jgi:hypothetical protein
MSLGRLESCYFDSESDCSLEARGVVGWSKSRIGATEPAAVRVWFGNTTGPRRLPGSESRRLPEFGGEADVQRDQAVRRIGARMRANSSIMDPGTMTDHRRGFHS